MKFSWRFAAICWDLTRRAHCHDNLCFKRIRGKGKCRTRNRCLDDGSSYGPKTLKTFARVAHCYNYWYRKLLLSCNCVPMGLVSTCSTKSVNSSIRTLIASSSCLGLWTAKTLFGNISDTIIPVIKKIIAILLIFMSIQDHCIAAIGSN